MLAKLFKKRPANRAPGMQQCPCGRQIDASSAIRAMSCYISSRDLLAWSQMVEDMDVERRKGTPEGQARMAGLLQAMRNWLDVMRSCSLYQCPACGRLFVNEPGAGLGVSAQAWRFAPEEPQTPRKLLRPVDMKQVMDRLGMGKQTQMEPDDPEAMADYMVYCLYGGGAGTQEHMNDALAAVEQCGEGWHSLQMIGSYLKYTCEPKDLEARLDVWAEQGALQKRSFPDFKRSEYRIHPNESLEHIEKPSAG